MRVGLYLGDLRRSATDSHGIINYALGLASGLSEQMQSGDRLLIFAGDEVRAELETARSARVQVVPVGTPRHVMARLTMDHVRSVSWARRYQLDLLHFPKGYIPAAWRCSATIVATVHDDIAIRYAQGQYGPQPGQLKAKYFAWATLHTLKRAEHVISDSNFSANCLSAHFSPLQKRLSVVPVPIALPILEPKPREKKQRMLLHFGSRLPHKHSREAVMWGREFLNRNDTYRLTVTGSLTADVELLCGHPRIERLHSVHTNERIAELLRDAEVLLFPSTMEGFGLPPVEAMAMGTPSVWAAAGALPEVMLGVPGAFVAGDKESFFDALNTVLSLADEVIERHRRTVIEKYSKEHIARQTLAVYRSLLSKQ